MAKMSLYDKDIKDPIMDHNKVLINRHLKNKKLEIYLPLENDYLFKEL